MSTMPPSPRTVRRARLWLAAAAVAGFLPALGVALRGWLDFAAFYAGGHFVGGPAIYDVAAVVRYQAANGMQVVPFVYPAPVALLYAPFAALPYALAAGLHLVLMTAALVWAAAIWGEVVGLPRRWAILGALAWAPAAASAVSGQNATVVLLLVALATRALTTRAAEPPAMARRAASGLLAGLAVAKPQLAAAAALAVAARGGIGAILGLAGAGIVHYGLGVVATGGDPAWPLSWLRVVAAYTREDMLANGWQASSIPTIGARLSALTGSVIPTVLAWVVAVAIGAYCLRGFRGSSIPAAVAVACAVGLVISPHAWVYDATLLLPAIAVLAADAARRGWPASSLRAFVVLYALATAWPVGWLVGVTPVALVVLGVALALVPGGVVRRRVGLEAAAT